MEMIPIETYELLEDGSLVQVLNDVESNRARIDLYDESQLFSSDTEARIELCSGSLHDR